MEASHAGPIVALLDQRARIGWLSRCHEGIDRADVIGREFWDWYKSDEDREHARRLFASCVTFLDDGELIAPVTVCGQIAIYRSVLHGVAGERYAAVCLSYLLPPEIDRLTPRELQICRLLGDIPNRKRLAQRLGLSLVTVEAHCHSAAHKLGCESAVELAVFCAIHFCGSSF